MAFNVQFKRSSILEKRPVAANMLEGEINLNVNPDSTGLFFKDDNGYVVKVGPAHMGPDAPNAVPGAGGSGGNTIGEFWYDTQNSLLKIYDGVNFVAVESGEVRTVSGVGAISVNSTDAENPVISVAAASTTTAGVVQLVDNTSSTSTTQALTANQGKVLQDQINSLSLSSNITLGGTFDPGTGLLVTVTTQGSNLGLAVGSPIPSPIGLTETFVISEGYSSSFSAPGNAPGEFHVGDWLLSDGTAWNFLDVGHQPASATETYAGVVELSTNLETQDGIASDVAVTPATLQSKLSDAVDLDSSESIASSAAVKSATDARIAGDAALQTSINNEASRAQSAEANLNTAIQAEEDRALAAEAAIVLAADAETDRAIAAEAALQSDIDGEISRATAAESVLTANLTAETNRATAAESQLTSALYDEEERALAAEQANANAIQAEASRAQSAEQVNADAIVAEEERASVAERVLTDALAAEETRALAAEQVLTDGLASEVSRATDAETALYTAIQDEETRATDAEDALDARVLDIEENLNTKVVSIFENATAVIADGQSPSRDPGYNDGWSYTNEAGQKVNWYFYDGAATPSTFATASFYSVVTLNSNSAGDVPFFSVYSVADGNNDGGSWYKSRKTATVTDPTALTVGKKYLFVFGEDPKVHPELDRVYLTVEAGSSVGTQGDAEALLTAAFSSNSGSSAGAVSFLAESLGVKTEEGEDTKYLLRFRKPTVNDMDAADAAIQAIAEAAIPDATMTAKGDLIVGTGDSTYVSVGSGSNGQILMADSSAVSGLGWFTTDAGTY